MILTSVVNCVLCVLTCPTSLTCPRALRAIRAHRAVCAVRSLRVLVYYTDQIMRSSYIIRAPYVRPLQELVTIDKTLWGRTLPYSLTFYGSHMTRYQTSFLLNESS